MEALRSRESAGDRRSSTNYHLHIIRNTCVIKDDQPGMIKDLDERAMLVSKAPSREPSFAPLKLTCDEGNVPSPTITTSKSTSGVSISTTISFESASTERSNLQANHEAKAEEFEVVETIVLHECRRPSCRR